MSEIRKSADISSCGKYRYTLSRTWGDAPPMVVIGHNPSTADANVDDPTIRRCIGFARAASAGGLIMLNLCAWRDTNPDCLTLLDDPVGRDNNAAILEACTGAGLVVAAWGTLAAKSKSQMVRQRPVEVLRMLMVKSWGGLGVDVYAFRTTKGGHPEHPLFLPATLTPALYRKAIP